MENIWIYVYIFVGANCFSCGVFFCEIIIFHRVKILGAISEAFHVCRRLVALYWRKFWANFKALVRLVRIKMRRR